MSEKFQENPKTKEVIKRFAETDRTAVFLLFQTLNSIMLLHEKKLLEKDPECKKEIDLQIAAAIRVATKNGYVLTLFRLLSDEKILSSSETLDYEKALSLWFLVKRVALY